MSAILKIVDHLVLAVPDLHQGIAHIHQLTGVKPKIGGQHMGRGTWNALLALGHNVYLELIAPDPQQPAPPKGYWMGVNQFKGAKLIHWAAKVHPIAEVIQRAQNHQLPIGQLSAGSRTRMNGQVLSWMLTEPVREEDGGLLPFLIDWEDSDHPAESLPQKCKLAHLEGRHPHPERINEQLAVLDIEMDISLGNRPQILASIETPKGVVSIF